MSDSESDAFIDDDSGSEDYGASSSKKVAAEPKPKAKASSKAAKTKAAPKPKAAAAAKPKPAPKKKKVLASSDAESSDAMQVDDDDEDDDDDDDESSKKKPLKEIGGQAGKGKTGSEMYQKLSQIEHILKRPDSYIGSVQHITQMMWVFDYENKKMVHKEITFVPGFFKIFDEILVNAADNKINDPNMDTFKVTIDRAAKAISVMNNGRGIPIEMHSKEGIYIPELIFGHLLTSSNYDDDEKKLTGGRNGYGAKLTNIYSTEFKVETADRKHKFEQTFSKNMGQKTVAKIKANPKEEEYTKITYRPELSRFGMDDIDDDTFSLLTKRVYDMAGTVKGVKVFLDGTRVKVDSFKKYIDMYTASAIESATEAGAGASETKIPVIFEAIVPSKKNEETRWEIGFAISQEQQFQQVSFVNRISTTKGGTHVEEMADQIAKKLAEVIDKKNKGAKVKPFQIKNHMWLFVNAMIENPAFDSQTKECLNTKKSQFGSKPVLSEEFFKKVLKSDIVANILSWAKFKADKDLKKTDGGKKARISGILKLTDANHAGTKNGKNCTLILTEGDSAKALAVAGLDVVGRDTYGVFPLRGKLLNVREASATQLQGNTEIEHIKKILGLKQGKVYTNREDLRYGSLMIMTDQDHDGSHIKGLLINFFDFFFPSLLKLEGFLVEFITPIVKLTKGKTQKSFFTLPEYEQWREENNDAKGWSVKYYKGLGTSTPAEAKKYFGDMGKHMLSFETTKDGDQALIDLAFNKKKADDRKEWLRQCKPGTHLDHSIKTISYDNFINKELILFSMADNIRSLPSVVDGLKPGQRKVIYGCYLKKLKTEIKVAQLAGFVSEKTAYHHGEQSLVGTIVGLAQDYVGSNNVNLLTPAGQYGTRHEGGKDHAAARYIFTDIPRINRAVFHPADDALLEYLTDDNDVIEPQWYMPVLPMILVNGADGIGTGWSTSIPNYNPVDIVNNLKHLMKGEEVEKMTPWFRSYEGDIVRQADDRFSVSGRIEKISDDTLQITELPIRKWTTDYKAMLEAMLTGSDKVQSTIKSYDEHHVGQRIRFTVQLSGPQMAAAEAEGLDKRFKIQTTISTTNMVCFDASGKIKKYSSPEQIIEDFYGLRLEYYIKRKDHLATDLNDQYEKLSNQARFIQMFIDGMLQISNRKTSAIVEDLRKLKFRPFKTKKAAQAAGEDEEALDDAEGSATASDYDYLLGMAIRSLTQERVEKLLNQQEEKRNELDELLRKSPQDLWNTDLENFLAEWQLVLDADADLQSQSDKGLKSTKGKAAAAKAMSKLKKGKAAIGSDTDDSEDDYVSPKKAAVKRKPPAAVKKAIKVDGSESEAKPSPAKKPRVISATKAKKTVKSDSESEIEVKPAPKKAAPKAAPKAKAAKKDSDNEPNDAWGSLAPAKAKAAPKKKITLVDSDDEESPKKPTPAKKAAASKTVAKPAAAKKAAPKKKEAISDSDEDFGAALNDDSMDMDAPVAPRASPRNKRAMAKKPVARYVDLSDDDDE